MTSTGSAGSLPELSVFEATEAHKRIGTLCFWPNVERVRGTSAYYSDDGQITDLTTYKVVYPSRATIRYSDYTIARTYSPGTDLIFALAKVWKREMVNDEGKPTNRFRDVDARTALDTLRDEVGNAVLGGTVEAPKGDEAAVEQLNDIATMGNTFPVRRKDPGKEHRLQILVAFETNISSA